MESLHSEYVEMTKYFFEQVFKDKYSKLSINAFETTVSAEYIKEKYLESDGALIETEYTHEPEQIFLFSWKYDTELACKT